MTNKLFPDLSGITFPIVKIPQWNSAKTYTSPTGVSSSVVNQLYPTFLFKIPVEFMEDTELGINEYKLLLSFFNEVRGGTDDFLFEDKSDNTLTKHLIGTGDNITSMFQITTDFGSFVCPVYAIKKSSLNVYLNDFLMPLDQYTINDYGMITFNVPPVPNMKIYVDCNFYNRVKFAENTLQFSQFASKMWSVETIQLQTIKVRQ